MSYEDLIARLRKDVFPYQSIKHEAADAIATLQSELIDWKDAARSEADRVNELTAEARLNEALLEIDQLKIGLETAETIARYAEARAQAAEKALAEAREHLKVEEDECERQCARAEAAEASLEEARDEIARLNKELDNCFVKREAAERQQLAAAAAIDGDYNAGVEAAEAIAEKWSRDTKDLLARKIAECILDEIRKLKKVTP